MFIFRSFNLKVSIFLNYRPPINWIFQELPATNAWARTHCCYPQIRWRCCFWNQERDIKGCNMIKIWIGIWKANNSKHCNIKWLTFQSFPDAIHINENYPTSNKLSNNEDGFNIWCKASYSMLRMNSKKD